MAKRGQSSARANQTAAQLGKLLGQVAARVDSWKAQRDVLRSDLTKIVDGANEMLGELGAAARTGRLAGRQAGRAVKKAGRRISAAARAKMAEAARRRWARERAKKAAQSK
jgi:hypothetical protein